MGGVDGLIHITDLSWGRVSDPKEVVELDQKLNVVILDFDDEKKRIALGLKQLTPHPWDALSAELKVGDKVKSGDLLCYIEAMKTYNAIRADFDGTVVAICVNPGDSVSEDDVLMKIG